MRGPTFDAFRQQFPEVSLSKVLSHFHPPCALGDFLDEVSAGWHCGACSPRPSHFQSTLYTNIQIRKQMLVFMLRNSFLTQLHTYLFLLPPDTQNPRFQQPVPEAELVLLSNRVKTRLEVKDPALRRALVRISVDAQRAGLPEPDFFWLLSTFLS